MSDHTRPSRITGPAGFRVVQPVTLLSQLDGRCVAFRPAGFRMVDNEYCRGGKADEAAECRVLVLGDGGTWRDLGPADVYWKVVVRMCHDECSPEYPWLVGVIKSRQGKWVDLQPPTPEQGRAAALAISEFVAAETAAEAETAA